MRDHISISALGFGCAPVMGKVARPQAMRAMAEAFDLGVTHFDVARSYGFGRAEEVVGAFIKGRRDKVTVTSKFGVVPPHLSLRTKALMPVARVLTTLLPQLKSRLKKKSGQLLAKRNFDTSYAMQCLNQSLAALATDYLDIYLVHEPDAALLRNPDELAMFMEDSVREGKIRRWGFAYQSVKDSAWVGAFGGDVIQFEGNIETLPDCGAILRDRRQRIVTRPFGGGFGDKPALEAVLGGMALIKPMRDFGASLADVSLNLSHQLAGKSGTVLCSMFSPAHIKKNSQAMNQFAHDSGMGYIVGQLMQSVAQDIQPQMKIQLK